MGGEVVFVEQDFLYLGGIDYQQYNCIQFCGEWYCVGVCVFGVCCQQCVIVVGIDVNVSGVQVCLQVGVGGVYVY